MITKELLQAGYNHGIVQLIDSPNNDGTVCQIGEHWFYFGGQTAEEMSAVEYIKAIPITDIINEIFDVLQEFSKDDGFRVEYEYYTAFLEEQIVQEKIYKTNI